MLIAYGQWLLPLKTDYFNNTSIQLHTRHTDYRKFYSLCVFHSVIAFPIVNFVKISVNWGYVVLIWLQVYHFCKNIQSAEKSIYQEISANQE